MDMDNISLKSSVCIIFILCSYCQNCVNNFSWSQALIDNWGAECRRYPNHTRVRSQCLQGRMQIPISGFLTRSVWRLLMFLCQKTSHLITSKQTQVPLLFQMLNRLFHPKNHHLLLGVRKICIQELRLLWDGISNVMFLCFINSLKSLRLREMLN